MAIEALYLFDVNEELIDIIPGEELMEHGQTQELKKLITANASALYSEDLEQAVFVGTQVAAGLPPGQRLFVPSEIADPGVLLLIEHSPPIVRQASTRETFEFVLTF